MRKKVDERIRNLIENGVRMRHRSLFVIIGDKSRDQIMNLHYMLSKASIKSRPSVLWCYKEKLELSSHKKKRAKQVKKLLQRGLLDPEKADAFSLFLESGMISYCLYKDSDRMLGSTYGMCILQDFEALTPNLLARSIETVEGGGLVVLVLRALSSLSSLYTMVMDVHERFRTEAHPEVVSRFNERFLLSLGTCKACLVMDDELNVLPISSHIRSADLSSTCEAHTISGAVQDFLALKDQLHDVFPVGPLVRLCTTLDQAKAVATFLDAILDRRLQSTIELTASRGRGKSAALGLAIAGAVAVGYSNIYITAPSPQNLRSLFEFVQKGLHALAYEEHLHYDLFWSNDSGYQKAIVQITIHKQHRQLIQYIQPYDCLKLSQVELLVVDEAAAIPPSIVKSLAGQYLLFYSSTVDGYEGTGRSLLLKLRRHLKEKALHFQELALQEPIRYATEDPIESWLNRLFFFDASNSLPPISSVPEPSKCMLYYVNKDTLFSFNKDSELFLRRVMSLFIASHYKNTPNDLQLLADAPAHHLFVLLGPVDESKNIFPDIICALQVSLEGQISRDSALQCLNAGRLPSGDQIPWKFCEEFGDTEFPSLSGARIVRIAVHPNLLRQGYGSAALDLLTRYYEGQLTSIIEADVQKNNDTKLSSPVKITEAAEKASLLEERLAPRKDLPPLFVRLQERMPEKIDYIGASFGLTADLFRFWKKQKFYPFYICETLNNMTGEHSCMVLKPLETNLMGSPEAGALVSFSPSYELFKQWFARRLATCFRELDYKLAMSILDPRINFSDGKPPTSSASTISAALKSNMSFGDLEMLKAYVNNQKDFYKIQHCMVPMLARCYFEEKLPVTLSPLQASLLLSAGLQLQDIPYIEAKTKQDRSQLLMLFRKVLTRFHKYLVNVFTDELGTTSSVRKDVELLPHSVSVDEDLEDGANEVMRKTKMQDPIPKSFRKYSIVDKAGEFEDALRSCSTPSPGGILSVQSRSKSREESKGCRKRRRVLVGHSVE